MSSVPASAEADDDAAVCFLMLSSILAACAYGRAISKRRKSSFFVDGIKVLGDCVKTRGGDPQ